jgi:hypothetical protein
LPLDANITLVPQFGDDGVGAGVKVNAKVSVDLYARRSGQSSTFIPAIQTDESTTTVLRVIFPPGFSLCQDVSSLQGNSVVLEDESWASDSVLGPLPALFFRQIVTSPRGSGIREPLPGQLDSRTNTPLRTGTTFGRYDPSPLGRAFELEFLSGARTTTIPNISQRLTFIISNIVTSQTIGPIPSPVDNSGNNILPVNVGIQIFGVQLFTVRNNGNMRFSHTMTYYNNRINDRRLDKLRWTWFGSSFVGAANLSSNKICPECASVVLQSSKMSDTTTVIFRFINVSPIPVGGAVRIELPGFDLGKVSADNVYITAQAADTSSNHWGRLSNVTKTSSSLIIRRVRQENSFCPRDTEACIVHANYIILVTISQIRNPSAQQVMANAVFTGRISTMSTDIGNPFVLDVGEVLFPPFTASTLESISASLDSYAAGAYPVYLTTSIITIQAIPANGVLSIRVPTDDIILTSVGITVSNATFALGNFSHSILPDNYSEWRFHLLGHTVENSVLKITLGPFKIRGFSGQIRRNIFIETRTNLFLLDVGETGLNETITAAQFREMRCESLQVIQPKKVADIVVKIVLQNALPRNGSLLIIFPAMFIPAHNSRVLQDGLSHSKGPIESRWTHFSMLSATKHSVLINIEQIARFDIFHAGATIFINITNVVSPNFVLRNNLLEVTTYFNASLNNSFSIDHGVCQGLDMVPGLVQIHAIRFDPATAGATGIVTINFTLANDLSPDSILNLAFSSSDYELHEVDVDGSGFFNLEIFRNATGFPWRNSSKIIVLNSSTGVWEGTYTLSSDMLHTSHHFRGLVGISGGLSLTVVNNSIIMRRIDRIREAIRNARRFKLVRCNAENPEECMVPCAEDFTASNCSMILSEEGWSDIITDEPAAIPANVWMQVRLSLIKFPTYSGETGSLQLTSKTSGGATIDSSPDMVIPDLEPGLLSNVSLDLETYEVAKTGKAKITFAPHNTVSGNYSFFISLPDGFTCVGSIWFSETPDCAQETEMKLYRCAGRNFSIFKTSDMASSIEKGRIYTLCLETLQNRPYAAGPSKDMLIQTRIFLDSPDYRVVDSVIVNGPTMDISYLAQFEVNVTSASGDVLEAGNEVILSVKLRSSQPVYLTKYARILLDLQPSGISAPDDADKMSVEFSCDAVSDLDSFCDIHLNNSQTLSGCSRCYFPEASVRIDENMLYVEFYEWSILPERKIYFPVDIPPNYLLEFKVFHLVARSSAGPETETKIGIQALQPGSSQLQWFDISKSITFPSVVPCKLLNVTMDIALQGELQLRFQLCQRLAVNSSLYIQFPSFVDCNNVSCDAYTGVDQYHVRRGTPFSVTNSMPSALVWLENEVNTNTVAFRSYEIIPSSSVITVHLKGLRLPIKNDNVREITSVLVHGLTSNDVLAEGNVTVAFSGRFATVSKAFFLSFNGGVSTHGSVSSIGFSFVLGAVAGRGVSFNMVFPFVFNMTRVGVADFRINGSAPSYNLTFRIFRTPLFSNITLSVPGTAVLDPGTWILFSLTNVLTPNRTGTFKLLDFRVLESDSRKVDAVQDPAALTLDISPGTLRKINIVPSSLIAGDDVNVSVAFTIEHPLEFGNEIALESTGITEIAQKLDISMAELILERSLCSGNDPRPGFRICFVTTSRRPAKSEISFVMHGLQNFPYATSQRWRIRTFALDGSLIDISGLAENTFSLSPGTAFSTIRVDNAWAGAKGNLYITFQASNPIPNQGLLRISLPEAGKGLRVLLPIAVIGITGLNAGYEAILNQETSGSLITLQFSQLENLSPASEAVSKGTRISVTLGPSVQVPEQSGPTDSLTIESIVSINGTEYRIDCAGARCPSGSLQTLNILVSPSILSSISLVPQSSNTRAGLSHDTRSKNTANLVFTTSNSIPAKGRIGIVFPQDLISPLMLSDPGCVSASAFNCLNSISCISGCDENFTVNRFRTFYSGPTSEGFTVHLVASRLGTSVLPAGTTIALILSTFSIPGGSYNITGAFTVCTATENDLTIDCGSAPGLVIPPASFQTVSMLDPSSNIANVSALCNLAQPAILYSNTDANQSFFFTVLVIKITNRIPLNGSINIDLPRTALSGTRPIANLSAANATVCSPRNLSVALSNNSRNDTLVCVRSIFMSVSVIDTSSTYRRLVIRVPLAIAEDSVINFTGVGKLIGRDEGFLRNRFWSGGIDQFVISTTSPSGSLLDRSVFYPYICNNGNISKVMLSEVVSRLGTSTICLSNVSARGSGRAVFPLVLPFSIPPNSSVTIRVYLPPDFKIQNVQSITLNSTANLLWTVKFSQNRASQYWNALSVSQRNILDMEINTPANMATVTRFQLNIGSLVNPPYAVGYSATLSSYSDSIMVIQFLVALLDSSGAAVMTPSPMFRFEWMPLIAPLPLSRVGTAFSNTAVEQSGHVNISFQAPFAIPFSARISLRMPFVQNVFNNSDYGYSFGATDSSLHTISWSSNFSFFLSSSAKIGAIPSDLAVLNTCSSAGLVSNSSFCFRVYNCSSCPGSCSQVGLNSSSFAPHELILKAASRATRLAYFYVPKVEGKTCNVSEPVEAQPLDWLVPESCNISGDYENTTLLLSYYSSEEIPAGSPLTLNINSIRNPLQLANCTGWFDLQIQQQFDLGWMLVGRTVIPCQVVPNPGLSKVFVDFSNLRTGCNYIA